MPTIDELKQQLAAGQQVEVLRSVVKLLALKGPAARGYDRYELYMLRGEAALRNKAMPMSADAFKAAQKETTDPDKQSLARANELLVRKSKQTGYTPKSPPAPAGAPASGRAVSGTGSGANPGATPGAAPTTPPAAAAQTASAKVGVVIPITEEADRKQAFAALLNDELAVAQPKLKTAASATALPPIIEVARTLGDLRAVEMASGGAGDRTRQIGATLGQKAHTMIAAAMNGMDQQVEEIWSDASRRRVSVDRAGINRERLYGLYGMNSMQANELKGIVATSEKIIPVARDLAAVTGGAELQSDAAAAQKLYDRAKQVLTYDYANEGRDTSKSQTPTRDRPRLPTGGTGDVVRP
ncbi:MAG: hypothetical protein ABIP55_16250 [Tepidisphaeraceae bacterium]